MKKRIEKIAAWLLILSLMTTLVPMNAKAEESVQKVTQQKIVEQTEAQPDGVTGSPGEGNDSALDNGFGDSLKGSQGEASGQTDKIKTPADDEEVTIIVELEKEPAKDNRFPSLFASKESARDRVKKGIKNIVSPQKRNFSNLFGLLAENKSENSLNILYDYDKVMNGFAVRVKYEYLSQIQKLDGVKNAFVEETYSIPQTQVNEAAYKNSDVLDLIGAKDSQYTGKGMVIAVIDSGLFTSHEAFVEDGVEDILTKDEVSSLTGGLKAGKGKLNADEVRFNKKIPFAYDYADEDTDVKPVGDSDHGTHVAGIATANGGSTVRGAAPDAQLVSLKVFSDSSGVGKDSDIIAALEDAVKLKVDVINMSLGSDSGFSTTSNTTYQGIYDSVKDSGILLSIAAGNSYSSVHGNAANNSLSKATEPDSSIIAAPSTYNAALAVASSTVAEKATYFLAGENKIRYQDATKEGDVFTGLTGAQEYVVCGTGSFTAITDALKREGLSDLKGKIALIERGGTTEDGANLTFQMKADYAANNGAIGIIVYDNVANSSLMDMGGITQTIPAVFISKTDGQTLLNFKEKKVTFDTSYIMSAPTEMSVFSSWGPTPDLKLKPEITAPGTGIYSTAPKNQYETMSGTSMATPQISGMSADVKQYIESDSKFNKFNDKEKDNLISSLLMSSATPVKIGDSWFSPRRQGAGLANITNAVNAKAYLTVEGQDAAKPKAELGAGTQTRSFQFTVHNLTSDKLSYKIDTSALSEAISNGYFQQANVNYNENGIDISYEGLTGGKVSVEANGSSNIKVTITFGEAFKQAVAEAVNGTFVDGFVQLEAENGSGSNLSLPYLAFYGDWGNASVFDGADIGGSYTMGQTRVYSTSTNELLGTNAFNTSLGVMPDKYVVATKGAYGKMLGLRTQTYLLRNADKLTYTVTQQSTGNTVMKKEYDQVKKSSYVPDAKMVSYVEGYHSDIPQFKGFDDDGNELNEGWYTYTVVATIPGTSDRTQNWSFDFYYDKSKPVIHSSKVMEVDGRKVLRLELSDNHYISGVELRADRKKLDAYDETLLDQKIYTDPDNAVEKKADKNIDSTYTLDINYDSLVGNLSGQNAPQDYVMLNVFDYGLNYVSEKVYLKDIYPESITLDQKQISLMKGQEAELKETLAPENTNKRKIEFISSNPQVADVDQTGKITAKSVGTATITVKTEVENVSASCEVTVTEIGEDTGIVLNKKTLNIPIAGDPVSLIPTLRDGIQGEIKWSSSAPEVVTVDDGVLTGKKIGSAKITASISFENKIYEAVCEVNAQVKSTGEFKVDENGVLTEFYGAAIDVHVPEGVTEIADKAFFNIDIQSVSIPKSVKKIGVSAFDACYTLETVTFEDGSELESIGERAFADTMLKSLSLPDHLTSIGLGAFRDSRRSMTFDSVTIPENVTTIPDELFRGNIAVQKVVLPNGITSIGDSAFSENVGLKEINIPSSLETIGNRAFNASGLKSFIAPNGLKSIGNEAFLESPLTEVSLNQGLQTIGDGAFSKTKVKSFIFPDSVTTVGSNVLSYAGNLKTVKIGKGITQLSSPFALSEVLEDIEVSENNTVYQSVDGVLMSKDNERIAAYPVGRENSSYTIPNGVTTIEDSAFMKATHLKSLDFSKNTTLKNIGVSAFEFSALESLRFPDSVEILGEKSFSNCVNLKNLDLNKVKQVGNFAFQYAAVVKPEFGDSLEKIGDYAFAYSPSLETVILPDSLVTLGGGAFLNSMEIKTVHIGKALISQDIPFAGASKLENLTVAEGNTTFKSIDNVLMSADGKKLLLYIPTKQNETYVVEDTVEQIGGTAFKNAAKLKKLVISEGLKDIGVSAFNGCTSLEEINLPDSLEHIGSFAFQNTKIGNFYVGNQIKQMDSNSLAFMNDLKRIVISGANQLSVKSTMGLDNLSSIYLGDGVKGVEGFSLYYDSLKTVVFGKDIEDINPWAFVDGSDITFYTIAGTKADSIVKQFTYGTVKNYTPLTISSFKVNQKKVTEETKLTAAITGGIGSTEYRFTKVNEDGTETELQGYSASDSINVQVPKDGVKVKVYVRDGSYYIVQDEMELHRGINIEGSFVAKAELQNSDGTASEIHKYFDGAVRIENTKETTKVGFKFDKAVKKVQYQDNLISKDDQGIYWITSNNLGQIPLKVTIDTEILAELKIDQTTLKTPAEKRDLTTFINEIDAFVNSKRALQDAKEIYTKDSFSELLQNLDSAKSVADNWLVSQEEVNHTLEELKTARQELKIAAISGRMYTATNTMTKEDGTTSMMAPILNKTASLERTDRGTWLVKFDIIANQILQMDISGENIISISYQYDNLVKDAKITKVNAREGLKQFQIEMKDLSEAVRMDIKYYYVDPQRPTSSVVYYVVREDSLVPVGLELDVNKAALTEKIKEAEAIDENKYTKESYAQLKEKIVSAQEVIGNNDATQEQVDTATAALTAAIQNLIQISEPVVDNTVLTAQIVKAKELIESSYTSESWSVLKAELAAAEAISTDENVTQQEIDAQILKLQKAIEGLRWAVDTGILSEVVNNAEQLDEKKYTKESYAVLKTALEHAEAILNDTKSYSSFDVAEAKLAIDQAIEGLVKVDTQVPAIPEISVNPGIPVQGSEGKKMDADTTAQDLRSEKQDGEVQTGDHNWSILYYLAMGGALAIAGVTMMSRKRRKE